MIIGYLDPWGRALTIRIGCWGILSSTYNKEHPQKTMVIIRAPILHGVC